MSKPQQKITHYEGLRGLAALVVLNEHIFKIFFGTMFITTVFASEHSSKLEWLANGPLNLFNRGSWAVMLFFVLSGIVLSYHFFDKGKTRYDLISTTVGRYLRLTLPILASLLLFYVLHQMGLIRFGDFYSLVDTSLTVEDFYIPETVSFTEMIAHSFLHIPFLPSLSFNPPLWTMTLEIHGSIMIFGALVFFASFQGLKYDWLVRLVFYALVIKAFISVELSFYIGFFLGLFLMDIHHQPKARAFLEKTAKFWLLPVLAMGLYLCGYQEKGLHDSPYLWIARDISSSMDVYLFNTIGATLVLLAAIHSRHMQAFFNTSVMQFFGKISVGVYLTHFIILGSFSIFVFEWMPFESYTANALSAVALTVPVVIVVGMLFSKFVDDPSVKVNRAVRGFIAKPIAQLKKYIDEKLSL